MKAPEASRSGSRCRAKAIAFSSWSGTWVRVPIYLHRPRACAPRHRGTGAGLPSSGYASSPCGAPRHQPPPPPPPTPLPTEPPEKPDPDEVGAAAIPPDPASRSEEHTSELQSRGHLVCRLLLEKKNLFQCNLCRSNSSYIYRTSPNCYLIYC